MSKKVFPDIPVWGAYLLSMTRSLWRELRIALCNQHGVSCSFIPLFTDNVSFTVQSKCAGEKQRNKRALQRETAKNEAAKNQVRLTRPRALSKAHIYSVSTKCTYCSHCGHNKSYGLLFITPCRCQFECYNKVFQPLRNYLCRYCRQHRLLNNKLMHCLCLIQLECELAERDEWTYVHVFHMFAYVSHMQTYV